jgi:DNA polymerase-1
MPSLFDVIKRENPDYLAVCFDKGGSQDRVEIFSDYKANRDETPEAIITKAKEERYDVKIAKKFPQGRL